MSLPIEGTPGYSSAKVAIPRLKRPEQQIVSSSKLPRARSETVNKACTRCRKRSGLHSVLVRDSDHKDKVLRAMTKNEQLTSLLKEARGDLDGELAHRIDDLLLKYEGDTPPATPSVSMRAMEKRPRSSSDDTEFDSQHPDENQVSASVGSNEDLDFLDEDLLGQQGSTISGYMGRNSQMQWMRTLEQKLNEPEAEPADLPFAPPGKGQKAIDKRAHALHQRQARSSSKLRVSLAQCYFYLDEEDIDAFDDVDADDYPPVETAERLTEIYKEAVHAPFRILEDAFFQQLRTFYEMVQRGNVPMASSRWKAVMNMLFAIGARFSHLIGADWQAGDRDHLIYMSRAVKSLELKKFQQWTCAPDSHIIQATGLLSFYYMFLGHVGRAWYMIGMSLRHAQAAGLHLRNENASMPLEKKKAISHTWWALHSIECIITSITGRPRVVDEKDCTTPLPKRFSEVNSRRKKPSTAAFRSRPGSTTSASPTTSDQPHENVEPTDKVISLDTFLDSWIHLDIIQHSILSTLYSAGAAVHSWKHMQGEITALTTKLDEWALKALPRGLQGTSPTVDPKRPREDILLYLYYQSARICVSRPCLCRLDKRIGGQSDESEQFNERTADACIQAALDLARGLPEATTPHWFYEKGCWWSGVHILMQAITVLLLELEQGKSRLSEDPLDITICVGKITRWLIVLKTVDSVAGSAYEKVRNLLSKCDQFSRRLVPGPWIDEIMQPTEHEQTFFENTGAHFSLDTGSRNFADMPYSSIPFGNGYNTTTDDSTLSISNLEDPLHYHSDGFQFSQSQFPLFYVNNFATLFDQDTNYGFADNFNVGEWDPTDSQQ
ncbi:hypothetical protein HBI34_179430 [Parastagonospora nodorum]|nr:hypothetical protein HBI34_179430 [Parastagonospora nodorum]